MATNDPTYLAYLLRLWREEPDAPWRGSLQDPHSGEQHLFASAGELLDYLRGQLQPDGANRLEAGESAADRSK
jgi:hypothetical protein